MKNLTVKIIYDNRKDSESFQEGWGFSALIETKHQNILFDTGNDLSVFFSNLNKLSINPEIITDVVLSHKHKDHITGLQEILLTLTGLKKIYVPKGFPLKKIPQNLHVNVVKDFAEIDSGIYSLVLRGGFLLYEQVLLFETEKGLVVITGCAHPGIVNILEAARKRLDKPIHLVLGGFHLFRENHRTISEIVSKVQSLGVEEVAPCHCCGDPAIEQFQKTYQGFFRKIGAGSILKIGQ